MKRLLLLAAVCCILPGAAVASLDCGKASSLPEKAICQEPDLRRMDGDMTRAYLGLRRQLTASGKLALLAQQRMWLTERDHECSGGEADCLRKKYENRLEQLKALNATAAFVEGQLTDVTPIFVRGRWKATAIRDLEGNGDIGNEGLKESLESAHLPSIGATVETGSGQLCLPDQTCDQIGWVLKSLGDVNDSDAIGRFIGLSSATHVLEGGSGSTQSYYLLVPQKSGQLWAIFGLCSSDLRNCRKAAEVWIPISPDATVVPSK